MKRAEGDHNQRVQEEQKRNQKKMEVKEFLLQQMGEGSGSSVTGRNKNQMSDLEYKINKPILEEIMKRK